MSEEEESSEIDEWIIRTEKALKALKEKNPKDRLELVAAIEEAIVSVNASTIGWNAWTRSPQTMKVFSEEELREIWESLRDFGCKFLELDLEWTKRFIQKKGKELKEKKEGKNKQLYIT